MASWLSADGSIPASRTRNSANSSTFRSCWSFPTTWNMTQRTSNPSRGRFTLRPVTIKNFEISGGLSLLLGGWKNGTKYVNRSGIANNGDKIFITDSAESNIGKSSPRDYYGGDVQLKLHHGWGETEWRAEYWFGTQPGTSTTTANPGTIPNANGTLLPT